MSSRLETAGDWLLRLEAEQLDPRELTEWVEWYGRDAGNRAAFDELQTDYETLRMMPCEQRARLAERLTSVSRPTRRPAARSALLAACLGAFVASGILLGLWVASPANRPVAMESAVYRTDRGKHELVSLPDGSQVRIGARSSVAVNYTDEGRYLVLEGGEAFFEVAHDANRPFIVQAGSVSVRAVGTGFNVRRAAERVMITVSQGTVDVVPQYRTRQSDLERKVRVSAGERITFSSVDPNPAVVSSDPESALAWQQGRLEFVDEPLRIVVATINRYSRRELILTDPRLGEMTFTGTVHEGRVDEWLEALKAVFPIEIVNAGAETVLLSPVGGRT